MRKINHGLSVEAQVVDEIIRSSMRNSLNELEHVENFPIFYCLDLRKCQRLARGEFIYEIAFQNACVGGKLEAEICRKVPLRK